MIEIQHYTKAFGKKVLLEEVNLTIPDETMIGLIGESGSGKTTLLRNISMLDYVFDGKILIDGYDIQSKKKKENEKFRVSALSYVFSEAYLLDYLTIEENAFLPSVLNQRKMNKANFKTYAKELGLEDLIDSKVDSLSAGEKQRVSILRALLTNKKYIICDEPTAHLDPENSEAILKLLCRIAHEYHKTVIIALHDYSYLGLFDKVYRIENQELIEYEKK